MKTLHRIIRESLGQPEEAVGTRAAAGAARVLTAFRSPKLPVVDKNTVYVFYFLNKVDTNGHFF